MRSDTLKNLRLDILKMAEHSAHVGVSLSCVDILAALYLDVLNVNPKETDSISRDTFILSKGHAAMALYAVLAQAGFIDKSLLSSYGQNDALLGEHPLAKKINGLEFAAGSLGHGLSVAVGVAQADKMLKHSSHVYVLLGCGECQEGSVWEACGLASARGLDNLTAIVDWNNLQACGRFADLARGVDMAGTWQSFGWQVEECDGHDYQALVEKLEQENISGRPRVLLCRTTKGKGVPFMENDLEWHYRPVSGVDFERAREAMDNA